MNQYLTTAATLPLVVLFAATGALEAQVNPDVFSLTTLYSFSTTNGSNPAGVLTIGANGALYGTANGGASGHGVVFVLLPPAVTGNGWTYDVLYSFTGGADGSSPGRGLVFGPDADLYGVTASGGSAGFGTVFKLARPTSSGGHWTESVLYNFTAGSDGTGPFAPLAVGTYGGLYGTAPGGTSGYGVAFELAPPATGSSNWRYVLLHNFAGGNEGGSPAGGLVVGKGGALFGLNGIGGTSNAGLVFELQPPSTKGAHWTEAVLYNFKGGKDGSFPIGSLALGAKGGLFGFTYGGGTGGFGTAFELEPPSVAGGNWTEIVLHSFSSGDDGAFPDGAPAIGQNGGIFGTTVYGGPSNDGIAFELSPPTVAGGAWTEQVLHRFSGASDGGHPQYGVALGLSGAPYGTTSLGGASNKGTVFDLTQ